MATRRMWLMAGAVVVNFSPLYTVEELAAQVVDSGARLLVIPASGHATPHDQPAAFNRALLEFLASD